MKTLFVVNPAAGRGKAKAQWDQLVGRLRTVAPFDVAYTSGPGNAKALAREATENGYNRVIAVGGDGTLFEVLNGVCGTGAELGVLPGGTGNDYAKFLGIPADPFNAAVLALTGTARQVDVGATSYGTFFINVAGAGFDAEVAATVNRYPKYLGGTIPYAAAVFRNMYRYRPQEMEILFDGQSTTRNVFLIALGLGRSYGGGMNIAPDAVVDDGLFDVCIAGDISRVELLQLFPKIYSGTHITHPKVQMVRARRVTIKTTQPLSVHADGEVIGRVPVEFRVLERHLPFVAPAIMVPSV